ncbi:MAG: hypothetical protein KDF48_15110 [Rhodocyclaceae bacterium]|nr:hypothetical protein [Rhodocyclaceae bacterium]
MTVLSLESIAFYCAFSMFVFYQQLHAKNFKGGSQSVALALNVSAFAGMVTGIGYLAYYGWSVAWWAPIVIFVIGILASMMGMVVERMTGALALSLAGFLGWPLCAWFMFRAIPA